MQTVAPNLRTEIKASTQSIHDALEQLPFSLSIVNETITRETYVRHLRQLRPIHIALEAELNRSPNLASVWNPAMTRAAHLEGDLRALGGDPVAELLPETLALLKLFETFAAERPLALLGALYVFEGSRLGSSILYMHLGRALGLEYEPGTGLDYHMAGLPNLGRSFRRLLDSLDAIAPGPEERKAVVDGALETFQALYAFYSVM